ncbi:MAG TPA: alcohol dehydrogenase catalytic domain-containing protein [Vicinamibacterales bacterium]|nr:alcohol dehydrogenase catalytic domain-containing protein [Vicinamibacterales bacterium]
MIQTDTTMLAAVLAREGVLELQQRPVPTVTRPTDVLLDVEGCGICGTDLHILASPPGHPATHGSILGHEFIGRVAAAGDAVHTLRAGQRVAVAPNISCGLCAACKSGRPNHCADFTTLGIFTDGGLARCCVAPERACHPMADHVPFEDAIWVEVLSCVVNSVDTVKALPGETVLVIGGGPTGALHALLFAAAGARVIVADMAAARLDVLKAAGIEDTVDASRQPLADGVRALVPEGADVVVDCVGNQLDAALDVVRTGGRVSLFGMNAHARPAVRQNTITRNELTIYGSYVGVNTFPRAIAILERGVIRPSALLSGVMPLERIHDALDLLRSGSAMKVVIRH